MVDPMPHDPQTDWARVMAVAGLDRPLVPSEPARWWLEHIVGTAQNIDSPPEDHDDFMWLVREIANGAANATNWLSIFACLNPTLNSDEAEQLEFLCQSALAEIAEKIVIDVLRRK